MLPPTAYCFTSRYIHRTQPRIPDIELRFRYQQWLWLCVDESTIHWLFTMFCGEHVYYQLSSWTPNLFRTSSENFLLSTNSRFLFIADHMNCCTCCVVGEIRKLSYSIAAHCQLDYPWAAPVWPRSSVCRVLLSYRWSKSGRHLFESKFFLPRVDHISLLRKCSRKIK